MELPSALNTTANLLFRAAQKGDLDQLKKRANELDMGYGLKKTIQMVTDGHGRTAFHFAAAGGKTNVCKFLIEQVKLDVNFRDGEGETPLLHAVFEGHYPTAAYLLQNGADPNAAANSGYTPLHHAAEKGFKKLLHLLISKGAKVDAEAHFGTPLQRAACRGKKEAVKILLDNNANPDVVLHGIFSPLVLSIEAQSFECLKLLLQAGADPSIGSVGMTPIEVAASEGEMEMVELLLKAGANPNVTDDNGLTPFEVAVVQGHHGLAMILFPVTTPNPTVVDWSFHGIIQHYNSEETMEQRNQRKQELLSLAKSNGEDAFKRKDYVNAISWYTKIIDSDPMDAMALSKRSLCWARLEEGETALADAQACIMLRPDWPKAHYREGMAWKLLKKFSEAAGSFKAGLELDPGNEELENAFEEALEAHLESMHMGK